MRGRIRTVKPEFFQHGDLYDAEVETGLPLRIAFAGLWCYADRRGIFEWKPRELKLNILPHDQCDFSRVLDALATRGFLVRYASGRRVYGWVPTLVDHQAFNNREKPDPAYPAVPKAVITAWESGGYGRDNDASVTRDPHVTHANTTRGSLPFPSSSLLVPQRDVEEKEEGEGQSVALVANPTGRAVLDAMGDLVADLQRERDAQRQQALRVQICFAYGVAKLELPADETFLTPVRAHNIGERLLETDGNPRAVLFAFDGCAASEFHRQKRLTDPGWICETRDRVEKFATQVKAFRAGERHPLMERFNGAAA